MKKPCHTKSLTLYDAAVLPMILIVYGVPLLIIIAVGIMIFASIKMIKEAKVNRMIKEVRAKGQIHWDSQSNQADAMDSIHASDKAGKDA